MDLRNICSKLDVDTIRAKIPPISQIKLPKSMSKLKSRKIFRSSREDISTDSERGTTRRLSAKSDNFQRNPASQFINRTPTRISTISSLVGQNSDRGPEEWKSGNYSENSYRNAGGIDDYCPSPLKETGEKCSSEPVSPLTALRNLHKAHGDPEPNTKMSFGEKLQKGYKDVSEFKIKHIFSKKTLVKADKIDLENYIPQIDSERRREQKAQESRDRAIADNYRFQFKVSQQKSQESYIDDSPPGSPQENAEQPKNHKNLSEQSGDESGMESTPPPRKPGIASTRFSRVRQNPLNMSLEGETYNNDTDIKQVREPQSSFINKPQKTPENITNSWQSPREAISSRDRHTPQNISLANDDDDINLSVEEVDASKPKQRRDTSFHRQDNLNTAKEHDFNEKQQILQKSKSIKKRISSLTAKKKSYSDKTKLGGASATFSKIPENPKNMSLESEVFDSDIDLGEVDETHKYFLSKQQKSTEKIANSWQSPRRAMLSRDRHTLLNISLENNANEDSDLNGKKADTTKPKQKDIRTLGRNALNTSMEYDINEMQQVLQKSKSIRERISGFAKKNPYSDKISYDNESSSKVSQKPINMSLESEIFDSDIELEDVYRPQSSFMNKQQKSPELSISSRGHHTPLNISLKTDDDDIDLSVEEVDVPKPKQKGEKSSMENDFNKKQQIPQKSKSIRERFSSFAKQKPRGDETKSGSGSTSGVHRKPQNISLECEIFDSDSDLRKVDEEQSSSYNTNIQQKSSEKISNSLQSPRKSMSSIDRHTPLNLSLEYDDDFELSVEDVDATKPKQEQKPVTLRQNTMTSSLEDNLELDVNPNTSSLFDIKKQNNTNEKKISQKTKGVRERISRLSTSGSDETKETLDKKRKVLMSPQGSEENDSFVDALSTAPIKSDKPFDAFKQNLKRMQKSVRLPLKSTPQSEVESECDETNSQKKTKQSKTHQFTERLKHFRSTDNIDKNTEDEENNGSPIHKIANKLQEWRKTIKKKVDGQHNIDNEDMDVSTPPQKQGIPGGSLIKKLKHIRSRKRDSNEDPDDDEEGGHTYKESLSARAKLQLEKSVVVASQMPQITMKKISETKKYFKKKPENDTKQNKPDIVKSDEEEIEMENAPKSPTNPVPKIPLPRPPPPIPRPYYNNSSDEDDDLDNQKFISKSIVESQLIAVPTASAAWTTKAILTEDTLDFDEELPRVLLHQDNSDVFESTLIIAVTRPISRVSSPIITEIPQDSVEESTTDTKPDNWKPNQELVECLMEMSPLSQESISHERGEFRKQSLDYSSDDSWIKDIPNDPPATNSVQEIEEPWKIQKENPDDILYKTKSIDLFEMQKRHGGVLAAFEDFDDELKNTPVFRIEKDHKPIIIIENEEEIKHLENYRNIDNYNRESSEELENTDDDNSSRITKISVHPPLKLEECHSKKVDSKNTDVDNLSKENTNDDLKPMDHISENVKSENTDFYSSIQTKISVHFPVKPEDSVSEKLEPENLTVENLSIVTDTSTNDKHEAKVNAIMKLETELTKPYDNNLASLTRTIDNENNDIGSSEEDYNAKYQDDEERPNIVDRPPSKSPSPPPSETPTPPTLPERKASIKISTLEETVWDTVCPALPPPPLPLTKPPIPPNRPAPPPPKIPERNPLSARASKPLVKTASLRLAYSEQVNPEDVGKVNKLISRFEPEGPKQRPRIVHRKPFIINDSEEYSDEEDFMELLPMKPKENITDTITTRQMRLQKSFSIDSVDIPNNNDIPSTGPTQEISTFRTPKSTSQIILDNCANTIPSISISPSFLDINLNPSRPSSVYSSPLGHPPSLVESNQATPLTQRKDSEYLGTRRNRRSMARDEEHYYSLDSDEENSYYSISSTGSNRYVVDL